MTTDGWVDAFVMLWAAVVNIGFGTGIVGFEMVVVQLMTLLVIVVFNNGE